MAMVAILRGKFSIELMHLPLKMAAITMVKY